MTIKVYKKRVHWYVMYNGEEFRFDADLIFDAIAQLYNKQELTFTITTAHNNINRLYVFRVEKSLVYSVSIRIFMKLITGTVSDSVCPDCFMSMEPYRCYYIIDIQ